MKDEKKQKETSKKKRFPPSATTLNPPAQYVEECWPHRKSIVGEHSD